MKHKRISRLALPFGRVVPLHDAAYLRMVDPGIVIADARAQSPSGPEPDASRTFVATTRDPKARGVVISAFADVVRRHPDAMLYLVATESELRLQRADIHARGITDSVVGVAPRTELGAVSRCGCLVEPGVTGECRVSVLEAAALGLATIVGAAGAGPESLASTRRVVPDGVESIAEAMEAFLNGSLEQEPVDFDTYNSRALEEFYRFAEGS